MMQYIYTKCLEKADDVQVEVKSNLSVAEANRMFYAKVHELIEEGLDNECLQVKADIHLNKAVVQMESVRHIVVIRQEEDYL